MAGELQKYRSSSVNSDKIIYGAKVPDDVKVWDTQSFHMMLVMAESNTADSGVTTEDPPDVTAAVAGHVITGYKKTISHSGNYLPGEPVCEYERYLYDHDITDERTVTEIVRVYTWTKDEDGKMEAYRATATCEVTQGPGGSAQAKATIAATYTYTSEEVQGLATIDWDTGAITFTPNSDVAAG